MVCSSIARHGNVRALPLRRLLLWLFASLLLAAPAGAEVRSGEGTDPAGDQPVAGRDIVATKASYDSTGRIELQVTLRGAPAASEDAQLQLYAGSGVVGGRCKQKPFVFVNALVNLATPTGAWASDSEPLGSQPGKAVGDTTLNFTFKLDRLADKPYVCADATIYDQDQMILDESAPIALVGPTPGPGPTPTGPTPTPGPIPPTPPPPAGGLPRIDVPVSHKFSRRGTRTRITRLRARRIPAGAQVTLHCFGSRCPFSRRFVPISRTRVADASRTIRRFWLRPGAAIELRVTAPGTIGQVTRYAIRRGRAPRVTKRCLAPGAVTPKSC